MLRARIGNPSSIAGFFTVTQREFAALTGCVINVVARARAHVIVIDIRSYPTPPEKQERPRSNPSSPLRPRPPSPLPFWLEALAICNLPSRSCVESGNLIDYFNCSILITYWTRRVFPSLLLSFPEDSGLVLFPCSNRRTRRLMRESDKRHTEKRKRPERKLQGQRERELVESRNHVGFWASRRKM